jgi:hypothetical protein
MQEGLLKIASGAALLCSSIALSDRIAESFILQLHKFDE